MSKIRLVSLDLTNCTGISVDQLSTVPGNALSGVRNLNISGLVIHQGHCASILIDSVSNSIRTLYLNK